MTQKRILVIEDDSAVRFALCDYLANAGYAITEAGTVAAGERAFELQRPTLVLTDYQLPDGNALELLPRLRAISATAPIIILTGHGSVELAVQAIREGADDFLTKPVSLSTLSVIIERALDRQRERQRAMVRQVRQQRGSVNPFVGSSPAIRKLQEQAERIVGTDRPVLILGETGAGKGVLTRWIHEHSPRAAEPLVDLNCASLPRELLESELFGFERGAFTGAVAAKMGLLELAHRGTLFLDEIGDMELSLQPKLLKVLEDQTFRRVGAVKDRQVDTRLVAATHQELPSLVAEGKFRGDLYFRISTIPLHVPSLRDRVEDIPELTRRLLDRLAGELGRQSIRIDDAALHALAGYSWPGNVRELRNVLERSVLLSARDEIRASDLTFDMTRQAPASVSASDTDHLTLDELERRHIIRVMELSGGKVDVAASRLGVPRSTLYQRLKTIRASH